MKQTKHFLRPLLMAIVMLVGMLVPKGAWAQSSPVTVGDEGFSTIQEAIDRIVDGEEENATLTLHQDLTLEDYESIEITFYNDKKVFNITIDLNGHTITGGCDTYTNAIEFHNYRKGIPTVTIDNSSQDKIGKLFNCCLKIYGDTKVIVNEGVSLYSNFEFLGFQPWVSFIYPEGSLVNNGDIYGGVANNNGGSFINNGSVAFVDGGFENNGDYCAYFNWADDGSSFSVFAYDGSYWYYDEWDGSTSITSEVTKEPTCTEPGVRTFTGTFFYDDQEFTDTKEVEIAIDPNAHDYHVLLDENSNPVFVWNEDYTTATLQVVCSHNAEHTANVAVTGEDIITWVDTPATCTTTGVRIYTATATYEGETYTGTKEVEIDIDPYAHDIGVGIELDAVYYDDIIKYIDRQELMPETDVSMRCKKCGTEIFLDDTESISGYSITYVITMDPNCWMNGFYNFNLEITIPSGDSYSISKNSNIYALGHSFTNHTLTAEPDEHGLYAYVCDREECGEHGDYNVVKAGEAGEGESATTIELTANTDGGTTTYTASAPVTVPDGAFSTPVDFTATGGQVSIDRTFTTGTPATINLPFNVDASAMSETYYTFSGITYNSETGKWVATMTEATGTLTANTPYIVLPANANITIGSSATVSFKADASANSSTTSGDWTMKAAKTAKTWDDGDEEIGKAYGFAAQAEGNITAGQFVKVGAGASIKAGRAYLEFTGETFPSAALSRATTQLPASIVVVFKNAETTGIGTLNTETGKFTFDGWYDLQGRPVSNPQKGGIIMNNNQKIIVK